jgi:hypothetical protein
MAERMVRRSGGPVGLMRWPWDREVAMSRGNRIALCAGLACTVLGLATAPVTAAAAGTAGPAVRVATDPPPGYVIKNISDNSLPSDTQVMGEITCPKDKVVLSGGAYIASSSLMTGIGSSYPMNDRTWVVLANNFSSTGTTFNMYEVCADEPAGYEQLESTPFENPPGNQDSGTMDCSSGDVLLGGGVIAGGANVSIVLTSSYPASDSAWTAGVSNFSGDVGDDFGVIAICAQALPGYAIPSTSGSDPAGVQKGIIQACAAPAVVLGGGNQSSNTANLRISIKTTQPFPASGTSWKSGENNDTSVGTTLTSYAICAT